MQLLELVGEKLNFEADGPAVMAIAVSTVLGADVSLNSGHADRQTESVTRGRISSLPLAEACQ